MKIRKFNESVNEEQGVKVTVKDLVDYLSSLDPDMEVFLDKDGWDYFETGLETVKNSGLFNVWEFDGEKTLTINN